MTDIYGIYDEDWNNSSEFEEHYGLSPDPEELFDSLCTRTIADDIKRFQSGSSLKDFPIFDSDELILSQPLSDTEIKHNCMWSGKCSPVSTAYNMSSMDNIESKAVPLAEITGNTIPESLIKSEPIDETEVETQRTTHQQHINQQNMQNMPPGTSLLLNPRRSASQQQSQQMSKKLKASSIQIPAITKTEFIRDRDLIAGSTNSFGRPDTPPSLDEDAAEFKHTCDLTACVVGSNNIKLVYGNDSDKTVAINRLREHLENNEKTTLPQIAPTFAEIMSIIHEDSSQADGERIPMMPKRRDTSTSSSSSASSLSLSSSSSRWNNQIDADNAYHPIKHSDHSYTRSKDGIDDISPNLETPSDSDEEIDVVSIGDKKLPTNPSDKDRRVLQSKVANKFVKIVKTPKGLLTIPPRRRVSYDYPYTPASVSPVKSGSSLTNSRYPSPASTPYSSSQYSSSSSTTSSSSKYNASRWSSSSSRKRVATNCSSIRMNGGIISNSDDFMPASKRHRGKKQKTASSVSIKRHFSLDEVDTIEKRNLHNDMERQRRIGLKNLFEALKKLIPSIKDKERAPKVNILREAAKLCENLTREEQHLNDHLELLKEQLRKRQEILRQLKMKQNAAARAC